MKRVQKFCQGEAQVPGVHYRGTMTGAILPAEESAAQQQLHLLATQQLDTDISLPQQIKKHRKFLGGREYVDVGEEMKGLATLGSFKAKSSQGSPKPTLDKSPFTTKTLEDAENHTASGTHDNVASSEEEPSNHGVNYSGARFLSRHEMEVELSLKRHCGASFLDGLVQEGESSYLQHKYPHPDHPMNSIDQLSKHIGDTSSDTPDIGPSPKPVGWKSLSVTSSSGCDECEKLRTDDQSSLAVCMKHREDPLLIYPNNSWVSLTPSKVNNKNRLNRKRNTKKAMDVPEIDSELYEKSVIMMPEEDIIQNRLSVGEIKNMPHFNNYEQGTPNKMLYVKNLSPKTTSYDLMSIFYRFCDGGASKPQVKLLAGRMRGQAFITFHDEEMATQALSMVNGFIYRGKPMILQYSKPKPS